MLGDRLEGRACELRYVCTQDVWFQDFQTDAERIVSMKNLTHSLYMFMKNDTEGHAKDLIQHGAENGVGCLEKANARPAAVGR